MDELDGRKFIEYFGGRSLKNATSRVTDNLFSMSLADLQKHIHPTKVDYLIKQRFWAQALTSNTLNSKKHPISTLYLGVCTYTHFWSNVLKNEAKIAWILRLPIDDDYLVKYLLHETINKLITYVETPVLDKSGNISSVYGTNLLKILEFTGKFI